MSNKKHGLTKQTLTPEQHKLRHKMLHEYLDEICADYIAHTGKLLSNTSVMELIEWSHSQTLEPTEPTV